MKILFTKSEYRTLLDMIYIAEWVLTAYDEEPDETKEKYHHLAQKIYSHAKEMGWESLVDVSAADNLYLPNRTYEDKSGVHELIEQYEADSFWDQLVDRLTERDVEIKSGVANQQKLSDAAYVALADPITEAYEREFAAYGIERLIVSDGKRVPDA